MLFSIVGGLFTGFALNLFGFYRNIFFGFTLQLLGFEPTIAFYYGFFALIGLLSWLLSRIFNND